MGQKILETLINYYPDAIHDYALPPELDWAYRKIINCRTIKLGGRICTCPEKHSYAVLYNSCKQRGCPQCNKLRRLQWIENKLRRLLPVEHNHLVFKLPSQLSLLWLHNKKAVADIMFDSVRESYEQLRKADGIMRSITNVLHTAGRNLSYHPHIHFLATIEGLRAENEWKKKYLAKTELEATYRQSVKTRLITGLRSGLLKPPTTEEEDIRLVERLAEREWDIFQSEIYANGEGVTRYLAKHIRGMAIDESQIRYVSENAVEILHENKGRHELIRLKPQDFVIRYLNHIPPKGLVTVRNLGLYSTKHIRNTLEIKKRLEKEKGIKLEEGEKTTDTKKIKCPVCGKEMIQSRVYNKYELKTIKWYLIDGSLPEHGRIYERKKNAA